MDSIPHRQFSVPDGLVVETVAGLPGRILEGAQRLIFSHGVATWTMEDLAHELGISKKTLYVHFAGKEAIVAALVENLGRLTHTRLESVVGHADLNCIEKLCALIQVVASIFSRLTPGKLRELQRHHPAAYARIDEIRARNIPLFFGRLLRQGVAEGIVNPAIDIPFATEFWLQAVRGLLDPDTLERTGLSPSQTIVKALRIYFQGLLTPAGQARFESHLACSPPSPADGATGPGRTRRPPPTRL